MSAPAIRKALEAAVEALAPQLLTTYANSNAKVAAGEPYQRVDLLLAAPTNEEMSAAYTEVGILQVTLRYPMGQGTADVLARAELIREALPRGLTIEADDCTITITRTASIAPGQTDADRWAVPVSIPFVARA